MYPSLFFELGPPAVLGLTWVKRSSRRPHGAMDYFTGGATLLLLLLYVSERGIYSWRLHVHAGRI